MHKIIPLAALVVLSACGEVSKPALPAAFDSNKLPLAPAAQSPATGRLDTARAHLTGVWQNEEDSNSVLAFRDGFLYRFHGHGSPDSTAFTLRPAQAADSSLTTQQGDLILSSDGQNWIIISLTEAQLTMIATGRGNTLSYHKTGL